MNNGKEKYPKTRVNVGYKMGTTEPGVDCSYNVEYSLSGEVLKMQY